MKPTCAARQSASSVSPSAAMSRPPTRSSPESGLSIPAIRLRSVVLPEPEGPISAVKSPGWMSSVMSESTGTICPPRVYDLARCRISTSGSVTLLLRDGNRRAVPDFLSRIEDDALAGLEALHLDQVAELAAGRYLGAAHLVVLHDERDLAAITLDDRPRLHGRDGLLLVRGHRFFEERDLRAHVGQHPRILVDEAHLDEHRGLGAIDGRHDPRYDRSEAHVRKGVELHLARLSDLQLADVRLGDVGFDFEGAHVRDGDYRALRARGRGERRDVVADVRILGQHDRIERRADQRLLDVDL